MSNKENKKSSHNCSLQEIYERYQNFNESKTKIDLDEKESEMMAEMNSKYVEEIQELKNHNKEMLSFLDIMQQNLKDLNEASKANLVESNRKWFQFAKDILQLAKRATKGEK